jgi:hypothetical protein
MLVLVQQDTATNANASASTSTTSRVQGCGYGYGYGAGAGGEVGSLPSLSLSRFLGFCTSGAVLWGGRCGCAVRRGCPAVCPTHACGRVCWACGGLRSPTLCGGGDGDAAGYPFTGGLAVQPVDIPAPFSYATRQRALVGLLFSPCPTYACIPFLTFPPGCMLCVDRCADSLMQQDNDKDNDTRHAGSSRGYGYGHGLAGEVGRRLAPLYLSFFAFWVLWCRGVRICVDRWVWPWTGWPWMDAMPCSSRRFSCFLRASLPAVPPRCPGSYRCLGRVVLLGMISSERVPSGGRPFCAAPVLDLVACALRRQSTAGAAGWDDLFFASFPACAVHCSAGTASLLASVGMQP